MSPPPRGRQAALAWAYRIYLSVGWVPLAAGGMTLANAFRDGGYRDVSTLFVFGTMGLLFVPGLIWRRSVYNEIAHLAPEATRPAMKTRVNPFGGHFRRLTQALSPNGSAPAPRMFTLAPRVLLVLGVGAIFLTGFLGAYYGREADRDFTRPLYGLIVGTGGLLLFVSGVMTSFGVKHIEDRLNARIEAAATSNEWNDALRAGQHRAEAD